MKKVNEWTGGIINIVVAIIGIILTVASGAGWFIAVLFIILLAISVVFMVLLREEKAKVKNCESLIAGENFKKVSLGNNQPFGLTQIGPIVGLPLGQVILGCIPFEILTQEGSPLILEVEPNPGNALNSSEIRIGVDNVSNIFLLVNTNYGLKSWNQARPGEGWDEKVVGRLRFEFQEGNKEQELRLGHHLRDTCVGNQPWAVDGLRDKNARNVWLGSDNYIALDLLKIDFDKPQFLRRIIVNAELEVDQPRQVSLGDNPINFPVIRIWGVTCRTQSKK